MFEKKLNVAITKCYGNADENSTRGKFNIPKKILMDMGITKEDCSVLVRYDEENKEMIVKKI
nr:hypothetical protein [Clostridium chromiireducens]